MPTVVIAFNIAGFRYCTDLAAGAKPPLYFVELTPATGSNWKLVHVSFDSPDERCVVLQYQPEYNFASLSVPAKYRPEMLALLEHYPEVSFYARFERDPKRDIQTLASLQLDRRVGKMPDALSVEQTDQPVPAGEA